jgi:uncharacterized protein (DUF433 family)
MTASLEGPFRYLEISRGVPVFRATLVPFALFVEYLAGGGAPGDFLKDFPSVSAEQIQGALELDPRALTAAVNYLAKQTPRRHSTRRGSFPRGAV